MTPRRPENIPSESPDQGQLFGVELHGNGATEPDQHAVTARFSDATGEDLPADTHEGAPTVTPKQLDVPNAVHTANVTRNRRLGQLGKHSALGEDGRYHPQPGHVLPGFGVVKVSNLDEASRHATRLNAERAARQNTQ